MDAAYIGKRETRYAGRSSYMNLFPFVEAKTTKQVARSDLQDTADKQASRSQQVIQLGQISTQGVQCQEVLSRVSKAQDGPDETTERSAKKTDLGVTVNTK